MAQPKSFSWFGLLALAGCGFQLPASTNGDGGSSTRDADIDGATTGTDATTDGAPQIDAPAIMLVDRGLVARYFIDEATTGQGPTAVADSATNPLALPITYGQATYTDTNGNRGLQWGANQSTGKIELNLGTTKFMNQISPRRTVTIEVVLDIDAAGAAGVESQITGLRGGNPDFMLAAVGSTDIRFFKPYADESATWAGANAQQRMVLHLVFDTTQATASARVELFKNGGVLAKTTSAPPNMNTTISLAPGDKVMIGNNPAQNRSIAGTIFYVAYYEVALNPTEISNNAQRLLANDDH